MRYKIRTNSGIDVDEGLMALRQTSPRYSCADESAEYRIEILNVSTQQSTLSQILSTISAEIESFNVALPYNPVIRLSEKNYDFVAALIAEEIEANCEGLHNLFAC